MKMRLPIMSHGFDSDGKLYFQRWRQRLSELQLRAITEDVRLDFGLRFISLLADICFQEALCRIRIFKDVNSNLKSYIFKHLLEKKNKEYKRKHLDYNMLESLAREDDAVLQMRNHHREIGQSITNKPFGYRLLLYSFFCFA